ncbi:hypothetical protein BJ742DRAFT_892625 [Cladochytrium replicatum]|nr:hypothetical protein BJ742DRAFT_892625 [Cladochytrium replicatum]
MDVISSGALNQQPGRSENFTTESGFILSPRVSLAIQRKSTTQHDADRTTSLVWSKRMLVVTGSQLVTIIALEAYMIRAEWVFINDAFGYEHRGALPFILVYMFLFLFYQIFHSVMIWEATNSKNPLQLITMSIFNLCALAYAGIQVYQVERVRTCGSVVAKLENATFISTCPQFFVSDLSFNLTLGETSLVVRRELIEGVSDVLQKQATTALHAFSPTHYYIMGAIVVLMVFYNGSAGYATYRGQLTAWALLEKLVRAFGWVLFYTQGANIARRDMMKRYHGFILLLKLNVYFYVSIITQFIVALYYQIKRSQVTNTTSNSSTPFLDLTISGASVVTVVAITYYLLGYYGVHKGNKILMYIFLVLMFGSLVAVLFLFTLIFLPDYGYLRVTEIWLSTFCVLEILCATATLGMGVWLLRDFDHGLSTVLNSMKDKTAQHEAVIQIE